MTPPTRFVFMGQNNDPTESGEPQGQQGNQLKISPEERKRQSGYPKNGAMPIKGVAQEATPKSQTDKPNSK